MAKLGINTAADLTNRFAVASDASLFDNDGDDHRMKINKATAPDTASLLFQTGYSGRAEFGLAGDDDFHVKVSADGSTWAEALTIDGGTGSVNLPVGQLGFPATQNPSADPNTLDDYEEGTWTPVIMQGAMVLTGTVDRASYVKIGRKVFLELDFTVGSAGSVGDPITIGGLPYAPVEPTLFPGGPFVYQGAGPGYLIGAACWDDAGDVITGVETGPSGTIGVSPSFAAASSDIIAFSFAYEA